MTPEERLAKIRALVRDQARDQGLWMLSETGTEAYLQSALRELHHAIGSDPDDRYERLRLAAWEYMRAVETTTPKPQYHAALGRLRLALIAGETPQPLLDKWDEKPTQKDPENG